MNTLSTLLFCSALLLAGCREKIVPTESTPASNAPARPPEKSTLQTVVGGFTGQTAVEKGKETRAKIEAISKKENEALNEVMP